MPLPNGNFSVVLASLQGNYSFNRFLTFTGLLQMDTSNAQAVSANLRLRYNYRPDSDLYVIYNVGTQFASIARQTRRKSEQRASPRNGRILSRREAMCLRLCAI